MKAGLGLAEAKALVEGAPKPILEGANKLMPTLPKKKLEEAGAKVEVQVIHGPIQGATSEWRRPAFRRPDLFLLSREIAGLTNPGIRSVWQVRD